MIKIIIVDGCSFTNFRITWATYLSQTSPYKVINLGKSGNSNDNIIGNFKQKLTDVCIDKIHLKIASVPKNEIKVAVILQLTGLDRKMINGCISPTVGKMMGEKNHKTGIFNLFGMVNHDLGWSGVDWHSYFLNEYTPEKHFNELLTQIIDLQQFIKKFNENPNTPKVEYKILQGWDIFTSSDNDQWSISDPYTNLDAKLVKDEFESSKELWDKIDWSKFWFYENTKVKYGGIHEWDQHNLDSKIWYYGVNNNTDMPTFEAHKQFKISVIDPMIEEMLN